MTALAKRINYSLGLNGKQYEDRITNLPCSLIIKILSCLPTKNAVATSVLSSKWKRYWTFVTNLDIDDIHVVDGDAPTLRKFTNFVNRVLLVRDRAFLQRVSLRCYLGYNDSLVNAWLIAIFQSNIQELDILIQMKHPCLLPSDIFLCSTLVVLKLELRGYVNMPTSPCLSGLRTLHLGKVELSNDKAITSLLSGCPVLEELSLCECIGKDVRVVNITAHALKSLIMDRLPYDMHEAVTGAKFQIVIDTPALAYFSFSDYVNEVHVLNMGHLIIAEIDFDVEGNRNEAIKDFLNGISQVENLDLSCDSMRVISMCDLLMPVFGNLTYLKLCTVGDPGWIVLAKLLANSPCLKTLHIDQGNCDFPKEEGPVNLPFDDVPSCFHFHLKNVRIDSFEYYEDEMEVVEFILKYAKVLKKLTLQYFMPDTDTVEVHARFFKHLLLLPRASTICKVVV